MPEVEYKTDYKWVALLSLIIALVVGILVAPVGWLYANYYTSKTLQGEVTMIAPDTQITYQRITFSYGENSVTESISCTGDFQFKVGEYVAMNFMDTWFYFWPTYSVDSLPAGCIALGQ